MKHVVFILLVVLCFFLSCDKQEVQVPNCENCNLTCIEPADTNVITNDCIDNWECSFKVIPNSVVSVNETQGVIAGNKTVFQMINSTQGSELIADDELADILVFELHESQSSFKLSGSDLAQMKVHFKRVCFCSEVEFKSVISGCIQGEKNSDGTWHIQGNLNAPYSFGSVHIKFDAQFEN